MDIAQRLMENLLNPSKLNERSAKQTGRKPPKIDLETLRLSHRLFSKANSLNSETGHIYFPTASTKAYSSNKAIGSLKRIAIADMKINIPAKGSYLLLRSIEDPHAVSGVTTIVEDHTGNVFLFTAYNLVSSELERFPGRILPQGTVFILKEPSIKTGLTEDFVIRSDSPSNVIIIHKHHPLYELTNDVRWINKISQVQTKEPETAEGWKQKGNDLYRCKDYTSALNSYLNAKRLLRPDEAQMATVLNSNLSITCLHLKKFEAARDYALKALRHETKNLKALFRTGRANYELRKFELAKKYFQEIVYIKPDHKEGAAELDKTVKRLREMTGEISVEELYRTSKLKPKTHIECADYVGPLQVVSSMETRRAVQATEDIEPGTLIAVSKALVCVFSVPSANSPYDINSDESLTLGDVFVAVQEACQLAHNNPRTYGTALYDLPINDAFLDAITPSPFCDGDGEAGEETHVDVERLRRILNTNGVTIDNQFKRVERKGNQTPGHALFLFPSYMNHSCLANATLANYNDVMVVHAIRHIKAGDEVTISRIDPVKMYYLKQIEYNNREVQCECTVCRCDRSVPASLRENIEKDVLKTEQFVKREIRDSAGGKSLNLDEITYCVKKTENLVKNVQSGALERYMVCTYYFMSRIASGENLKQAVDVVWKGILTLGFTKETLNSWSEGICVVPKDCLFSSVVLSLIQFLVLYYTGLESKTEAKKYLRAMEFGYTIRGVPKQMIKEITECKLVLSHV